MKSVFAGHKMKLYAVALAGAGALALFGQPSDDAPALAQARHHPVHERPMLPRRMPDTARFLSSLAHRASDAGAAPALFAAHTWYVLPQPPSPPPAGPPPPPAAPPLPFAFIGRYVPQGDPATYFLTRNDRIYDVRIGETIDGDYSLDAVEGSNLVFTYLPLKQRQSLPAGGIP